MNGGKNKPQTYKEQSQGRPTDHTDPQKRKDRIGNQGDFNGYGDQERQHRDHDQAGRVIG